MRSGCGLNGILDLLGCDDHGALYELAIVA
jgi:hypothetical protein